MKIFVDTIKTKYLKDQDLVIDIETTGVHRQISQIQVIGILSNSKSDNFTQFLCGITYDKIEGEKEVLEALKIQMSGKNIISYNGINFDLPFIFARMTYHGIEHPQIAGHFDLYTYLIENRFFFDTQSFSLQYMEELNNIVRYENFEKINDQEFYNELLDKKLAAVCLHNKYDVINTEKLIEFTNKLKGQRTFTNSVKNKQVEFYIEKIVHNKNIVMVKVKSSNLQQNQRFESSYASLIWQGSEIKIYFKVHEGYISPGVLGFAHIQKLRPFIEDQSQFKLKNDLLLIYHNRHFELENIIKLTKRILDYYEG